MAWIDDTRDKLTLRYRFLTADNLIDVITNDEIDAAILDAVDEINSFPPQTSFDTAYYETNSDPRWGRLLLICAAKNVLETLYNDWIQNGVDARVGNGEFEIGDRTQSISDLLNHVTEEYEKKAEQLKTTSQRFIHGVSAPTSTVLAVMPSSFSRRIRGGS